MVHYILFTILGLCVLGLIYCLWILYRNKKVHSFFTMLILQCNRVDQDNIDNGTYNEDTNNEYDLIEISYEAYSKVLFSFKPLRPIYWLSKESYDILFPETPYDYEP